MSAIVAACAGGQGDLTLDQAEVTVEVTEATPVAESTTTTTRPTTTTTEPTTTTTIEPALELLAAMTLEQKIGQMLMPVVGGTTVGDSADPASAGRVVTDHHVGGVIYLGNNIESAGQLTTLSADLQAQASLDSGIGLLVAVDQEGGRVVRIRDGVTVLPSARSYEGDAEQAQADAFQSGSEMQLQGINMVLAPVAGVTDSTTSVIGNRSYSSDPTVAAAMVAAVIEGYESSGIAAVVKHWPGHGSTEVDSHQSLPTLDISLEQWHAGDRLPFEAAVGVGVDAIMVGHLAFPALDPTGAPATYSAPMIDEALREVLGFDGVVMTDALDMGAVNSIGSGDLAVRSVAAGTDLLLAPLDLDEAAQALLLAVENGTITEQRIDASVLRLLRLKLQLGIVAPAAPAAPVDPTTELDSSASTVSPSTTVLDQVAPGSEPDPALNTGETNTGETNPGETDTGDANG